MIDNHDYNDILIKMAIDDIMLLQYEKTTQK